MRPEGAYSAILSFFPHAPSCEQSELDVCPDFYHEMGIFKAVRGPFLAVILY
jgi:hypothetical protein